MKNITHNLLDIDGETRLTFLLMFGYLKKAEKNGTVNLDPSTFSLDKELIRLYYEKVSPCYDNIISSFKKKYITTESRVEKNDSPEEQQGIKEVYDYIQDYDISKQFNPFIEAMLIHCKLWSIRDAKFKDTIEAELRTQAEEKLKKAKETKDIALFKEAQAELKSVSKLSDKSKIGGQLRTKGDDVYLQDYDFIVPSPREASEFMNSLTSPEKLEEFNERLNGDLIEYINYCVILTTDLIKYQPFNEGNKRTFRGLLNLMFKLRNIPPVYIKKNERDFYKKALFEGIIDQKYDDIIGFYYHKICDSIYELDAKPFHDAFHESKGKLKKILDMKKDGNDN